jgi:hypothetical protein
VIESLHLADRGMQQNVSHDLCVVDSWSAGFLHIHLPAVLFTIYTYLIWCFFFQLLIVTLNFHVMYASYFKFRVIHFIKTYVYSLSMCESQERHLDLDLVINLSFPNLRIFYNSFCFAHCWSVLYLSEWKMSSFLQYKVIELQG